MNGEMYECKKCGWIGEYPFADRNGDPYDPETEWVDLCPHCFELVERAKCKEN